MAVNPILFLLSAVYLTLALTSPYMRMNAVATVVALSLSQLHAPVAPTERAVFYSTFLSHEAIIFCL